MRRSPAPPPGCPVVLSRERAREPLACYGIETVPYITAASVAEGLQAAETIGYPVALKAVTKSPRHRMELGGVRLNIDTPEELTEDFTAIQDLIASLPSDEEPLIDVQAMAPPGVPCVIRAGEDRLLGPMLSFSLAGDTTELLGDVEHRVAPLTDKDAGEMIRAIKSSPRLFGYRDAAGRHRPPHRRPRTPLRPRRAPPAAPRHRDASDRRDRDDEPHPRRPHLPARRRHPDRHDAAPAQLRAPPRHPTSAAHLGYRRRCRGPRRTAGPPPGRQGSSGATTVPLFGSKRLLMGAGDPIGGNRLAVWRVIYQSPERTCSVCIRSSMNSYAFVPKTPRPDPAAVRDPQWSFTVSRHSCGRRSAHESEAESIDLTQRCRHGFRDRRRRRAGSPRAHTPRRRRHGRAPVGSTSNVYRTRDALVTGILERIGELNARQFDRLVENTAAGGTPLADAAVGLCFDLLTTDRDRFYTSVMLSLDPAPRRRRSRRSGRTWRPSTRSS